MEPTSCVNDFCEDIQPLLNALLVKIEANPNLIHVLLQQLPETLAGYNFGLTIENPDGSVRASAATTSSSVRSDCRAAEDAGQSKTQRHVHPVPAFGHLPLPLHLPPFDHHHNSTNYPPPQMPSHHMPPYHPPAYNHGLAPYQFHGPRHGYHHGGRGWNGRPSFRSSPVAQPPQPVCTTNWSNIICNGCNKSGFTGPRHKCASCSDYDLCATCFADAAKSHTAGHKFFTLTTKDQQHRNIFCDGCKIRGIVGDRFKCTVCFDYDLCGVCHRAAGLMHAGHAFTQIMPGSGTTVEACERVVKQVEEAGFEWRGVVCDGCDRSNFRGKRYRCDDASCADYGEFEYFDDAW
ncbi:hypothetical protein BC830DRAFT_238803 [Chytriomyces sp. MP71]|nr:hypothetical protein BC830DRAFT_238803 [Chytriomyces sp. MP71]